MTKLMAEPPISRSQKRSGSPGARAPFGALWWRVNSDRCTGLDEKKTLQSQEKPKSCNKRRQKNPKMTMAVISHITPTSGSSCSVEETCMNVTQKIQKIQKTQT